MTQSSEKFAVQGAMLHVVVGMSSSQFTPISPGMPIPLARQWAWHTERKKPGFAGSGISLRHFAIDRCDQLHGVAIEVLHDCATPPLCLSRFCEDCRMDLSQTFHDSVNIVDAETQPSTGR